VLCCNTLYSLLLLLLDDAGAAGALGSVAPVNGQDRLGCCSSADRIRDANGHIMPLMLAVSWLLLVLLLPAVVAGW
jgi:hypothetical protein